MNARSGRFSHWLLLLTIALAAGPATSEVETPLTVSTATFEADGHAPRQVALPHTWALDGLAAGGKGQYRIDFRLAEEPPGPWALVGSRLASLHAVRLNGALVHGTMAEGERERRGVPVPMLIDLPPALLKAGDNRLEIDVDFHFRAGMSSLVIGPTALVRPAHLSAETWNVVVPQAMNVVATGLALLMLTIWLRRRSEREQRGARRRFGARAQFLVDELRFGSVRAHRPRDPGSRTRRFRSGRERHGSYGARPLRRQVLVHLQSGIVSGANTVLGTVAITITDDVLTGVGTPTYRRACRTRPSTWTAR